MHRTLQDFLWLTPAILQVGIAVVMFRRNMEREYPVFWSYLLLSTLRTFILFGIGNDAAHYAKYFYTYWTTEIFASVLELCVVAEIFRKAFAERLALRNQGAILFRVSLSALVLVGLLLAVLSPGRDPSRFFAALLVLKRAESLVLFGLVAALFFFVFVLGLPWTNCSIGLAAGFGVQGAAEVTIWTARSYYGRIANRIFVWGILVSGFCQVLIWAIYFARSDSKLPLENCGDELSKVARELSRMDEQLAALLERRC
jgi:hypothetical protein